MHLMNRYLLVAAALLTVTACGNTDLTARGSVIASFEGADTGFQFEEDTRLEAPERGGLGLITGGCEMVRRADVDGVPAWGIVIDLLRGGTVNDNGLSSVTIMQSTDALATEGRVEAELGMISFVSGAERCSVEMNYAEPDSGMVGMMGTCEVQDSEGNVASVAFELDVIGCAVIE